MRVKKNNKSDEEMTTSKNHTEDRSKGATYAEKRPTALSVVRLK